MRPPLHHRRSRRGSNAIEFALCMPVWIAIVFAIMDFGWLFYQQTSLDAATNLGCRAGSLVDPGDSDSNLGAVTSRANDRMKSSLLASTGTECKEPDCVVFTATHGAPPRRSLTCDAQARFEPLIGLFLDERTLGSTQVARLEWQREAAP